MGYETVRVSVMPVPSPIIGATDVCYMVPATYMDASPGGVWSASPPGVTSITSFGVLVATTAGTAILTYAFASGCFVTRSVSVYTSLPLLVGLDSVCLGLTATYTNSVPGGAWSSSNASVGAIGASGLLTPMSPGTTVINYSIGGSCVAVKSVTVNPMPSAISAPDSICVGDSILLSDTLSGGTWFSSVTSVATVSADGELIGVSAGSVIVSYVSSSGCAVADTIIVKACPLLVQDNEAERIVISPNPVVDLLTISKVGVIENLELYNCIGALAYQGKISARNAIIDMSRMPPGVYTLVVNDSVRIKISKY